MNWPSARRLLRGRIFLVMVVVAISYWLAETAAHVFLFETGGFAQELASTSANELWMRTFTAILFLAIGMIVQNHNNKMHEYQERLRTFAQAVEAAGEGILITDSKCVIEYVNASFTRITGYSSEEAIGALNSFNTSFIVS